MLSGDELPALVLLHALARLQPGVMAAPSHELESVEDGLLEGPHYSRPEVPAFDGQDWVVPGVLLSGHHARIAQWRREQALATTARRRTGLIAAVRAARRRLPADERFLASLSLARP